MPTDNRNRIPAGEQTAYTTWRPPEVTGASFVEIVRSGEHQPGGAQHSTIGVDIDVGVEDATLEEAPAGPVISVEELERITQQAHDEGFAAGYEEGRQRGLKDGHEAGLAQGQQDIRQRLAQLQTALRKLMEPIREQEQEIEEALFSLVITLAQAVLRRELKSDPQDILDTIHLALEALPMGASNIRVQLSEPDAEALKEHGMIGESWQVVADRTLKPGDVRVQTLQSLVEFTVQERFSQSIEQMLEAKLRSEQAAATSDMPAPDESADSEGGTP